MIDITDMINLRPMHKVGATVLPRDSFEKSLWQSGSFTFRKENIDKEASFMNTVEKKSRNTVAPTQYTRNDLNLFNSKPHFSYSKAAKISCLDEIAKRKQFIPGLIYDLSDKQHRTIGTINL